MKHQNSVYLTGRVTDISKLRQTSNGKSVLELCLETHEEWATGSRTEQHTVAMWGARAEQANQELSLNDTVKVSGSLTSRTWTDYEGVEKKSWSVAAWKVENLSAQEQPLHVNTPQTNTQPAQTMTEKQLQAELRELEAMAMV